MPKPTRVLAIAALLSLSSCATRDEGERVPDRRACERYRDHLVDLRLEGAAQDRAAHRAALAASLGDSLIDQCIATMDVAELDCVAQAATLEAARTCANQP